MEGLESWRLCDELNVIQAALLIVGVDPSIAQAEVEASPPDKRPEGYEGAKAALQNAILNKKLNAKIAYAEDEYGDAGAEVWKSTVVAVNDLREWLQQRGTKTGFFFPGKSGEPDHLNPNHPNFSPKLAAAVQAWTSVSANPDLRRGKTVKQALVAWLNENASQFVGLTRNNGKPNELGIREIAKIANWETKGGAPKTPSD